MVKPLAPVHITIAAASDKTVQFACMHGATTIGRCFREIGYSVSFTTDLKRFARIPQQRHPDILAVDVELHEDTIMTVEHMLEQRVFRSSMVVLLYNFPTPELIHTRRFFRNTYYLGNSFTDRDLFAIASRLICDHRRHEREAPALEGGIFDESLIEVFQFLEIGRKSGVVLLRSNGPYGMVYILDGRITYAATGSSCGKEALVEMLSLKSGSFKFASNRYFAQSNCNCTISEILMNWARTIDETRHYAITEPSLG